MSDRTDIERVREATDLVALISEHVQLSPKGREWVGVCPFHDDHRPSFAVVTHKGNAFYKCHSCGAAGDCFAFLQKYLNHDFPEALRLLAERANIELTRGSHSDGDGPSVRTRIRRALERAADLFAERLRDEKDGRTAREMLEQRGFSQDSIDQFGIGFAPDAWDFLAARIAGRPDAAQSCLDAGLVRTAKDSDRVYDSFRNRLMFPIHDETGHPIAFGGRRINEDEEPKYINSPETELFHKSRTLYGMHIARREIVSAGTAVVVEGYTDVIACHQAGFRNVVGTLGTALTIEHATALSRLCDEIILVFDGDAAGRRAADRAVEVFFRRPVDVRICVLPEGRDPGDLAGDVEAMQTLLASSREALAYTLERLESSLAEVDTVSGRQRLIERYLDDLLRLGFAELSGVRRSLVMERIGQLLKIDMREVESLFAARPRPKSAPKAQPSEVAPPPPAKLDRARVLAERECLAVALFDPIGVSAVFRERNSALENIPTVDDFHDVVARHIAQCVLPHLLHGSTFRMQDILDELTEDDARTVASRLYFDGQRLCEHAGSVNDAVASTLDAMLASLRDQQFQSRIRTLRNVADPDDKMVAAQHELDQLRQEKIAGAAS